MLNRSRVAGLQGLQGIVRKTADEDVARFYLYDKTNLSKILPAVLMNIEKGEWEAANKDRDGTSAAVTGGGGGGGGATLVS